MPYPGIPDEKTEEMESCVLKVLAQHKGEKDFDKSNAIAICHDSIMGTKYYAVEDPSQLNVVLGASYQSGELMRFENAELAKVEVNANSDELLDEDINSLAATLPLMPLDDEHNQQRVIGVYTAARNVDGRLMTDGIVYARRFPEVANDIIKGRKRLSVEAAADIATCSTCGQEFAAASAYCEHLRTRRKSGAKRRFKNLRAIGGGVVSKPAGSTAGFDLDNVRMVASHQEDEDDAVEGEDKKEKWSKDVDLKEGALSDIGWPSYEKIASSIESGKVSYATAIRRLGYIANVSKDSATSSKAKSIMEKLKGRFRKENDQEASVLEAFNVKAQDGECDEDEAKKKGDKKVELDQIQQQLNDALAKIEELNAQKAALESKVTEVEASVKSLTERNSELLKTNRRFALASVMSDEEFASQESVIMGMSDEAVNLLASAAKPKDKPPQPVVNLDPPSDRKITL